MGNYLYFCFALIKIVEMKTEPGVPATATPAAVIPAIANSAERDTSALCCTDQQLGEVSPPHRHLFDANVFRPPKLQHTVERRDSNGHLGRLPPFGPRAQCVTN